MPFKRPRDRAEVSRLSCQSFTKKFKKPVRCSTKEETTSRNGCSSSCYNHFSKRISAIFRAMSLKNFACSRNTLSGCFNSWPILYVCLLSNEISKPHICCRAEKRIFKQLGRNQVLNHRYGFRQHLHEHMEKVK